MSFLYIITDIDVDNNILIGHFSLVHERFASQEHIMETNITVKEWKKQLENVLKVHIRIMKGC